MAQYVFSMNRVGKIVPPKRHILKDISLSFFPGAKIGVLGLNGSGKSTLLKIMAGIDKEIEGEAIPMAGLKIGYLPQEPQMDPDETVREAVEGGMGEAKAAQARLEEVYAAYAEEDADFDALAAEQAKLEAIIATAGDASAVEQAARVATGLQTEDVVFVTITDGQENQSREYNLARITQLVDQCKTDGWTFVYISAALTAYADAAAMGYDRGSTQQFQPTADGSGKAFASMSRGMSNMRDKKRAMESYDSSVFFETGKDAEDK
jgi:ABC-type cobalamin/Fe3+-siderophores transport system ATPase subunit